MEERITIDYAFISDWHPKYDESENDEPEYQSLVTQIRSELNSKGTLAKDTFIRVLDWKSPRVKGIVRLDEYPMYAAVIADAVRAPKGDRLRLLCQLHGVGAPVGSTLLHLMFPSQFPIIDIRTVQTLHRAGLVGSDKTDLARYPAFMSAILGIAGENPEFSLREIDRALFAYHKLALSPKLEKEGISMSGAPEGVVLLPKHPKGIPRRPPSDFSKPRSSTMGTKEKVVNAFSGKEGQLFSKNEIVDLVVSTFPGTNSTSVIPSDYCYNMINVDPSSFKLHGFEFTREKKYKWLGPEYPYSGLIYWKGEIVGEWLKGQCHLRKDPRRQ